MARNFNAATDRVEVASNAAYDLGLFSIHVRFRCSGTPSGNPDVIVQRCDSSTLNGFTLCVNPFNNPVNSLTLQIKKAAEPNVINISTSTAVDDGAWHSVGAVMRQASGATCRLYQDGTQHSSANTADAWAFAGDTILLGDQHDTFFEPLAGDIAEFAWWDVELDAAEFAALHAGFSPLLIRPTALVSYWPLLGRTSPEIDLVGGRGGTVTGTTAAAHPRVFNPATRSSLFLTPDRRSHLSWAELEIPTAPRRGQLSWAEFELPNAPRRGQVSWAEVELPNAPRRGQLSWAELELPNGPRRGQVSWAEFEIPSLVTDRRGQISFAELELPNAARRALISWAELGIEDVIAVPQIVALFIRPKRRRRLLSLD